MNKQRLGAGLFLLGAIWLVVAYAFGASVTLMVIPAFIASVGLLVIAAVED